MKKIKIVYFGTPQFAVPPLATLSNDSRFEVVLVVTTPDVYIGRKQEIAESPVALMASKLGIPVLKPESLRNDEVISIFKKHEADYFVVLAYGKIFPKNILEIPKIACVNVHGSILPHYRGASPVQSALMSGESETGITIMLMDEKMDEGDILEIHRAPITTYETTEELMSTLSQLSSKYLPDALIQFADGSITPIAQDHTMATYTKKLLKEDGYFNPLFTDAEHILWKWKGVTPWPSLYTFVDSRRLKILKILLSEKIIGPGIFEIEKDRLFLGTKKGSLEILFLQIEGKKVTSTAEYISGLQGKVPTFTLPQ